MIRLIHALFLCVLCGQTLQANPVENTLKTLEQQYQASPNNPVHASALAQAYWQAGRTTKQRENFEKARAVLKPWWTDDKISDAMRAVRGFLQYEYHALTAAQDDLSIVVKNQPNNLQAWMTLATVQRLQGDYAAARDSCHALGLRSSEIPRGLCQSQVLARIGAEEQALIMLEDISYNAYSTDARSFLWVITEMAVLHQSLAHPVLAEKMYQQVFDKREPNVYLLRHYADLLLSLQRPDEVMTLLENAPNHPHIHLRKALALKALKLDYQADSQAVKTAVEIYQQRGDHSLDLMAAQWRLDVLDQPHVALKQVLHLWQVNKEPDTAQLVLRAATAAKQDASADAVKRWAKQHNWSAAFVQTANQ